MSERFTMTISLNVLNHLGVNLYSNVPAVLSEAVANSWDADAEHVDIFIEPKKEIIVIRDDGHGMDVADINNKYLNVGYERRKVSGEEKTPKWKRDVMGRKGIGKLSLFSIANTVEVHSVKGNAKCGFVMKADKIKKVIEDQQTAQLKGELAVPYHPDEVQEADIEIKKGTQITLTDLKKGVATAGAALRRRLARRFSVLGSEYHFVMRIENSEVKIEDRDYFHLIQYLWTFEGDSNSKLYQLLCARAEKKNTLIGQLSTGDKVRGWIGTVNKSGALKEDEESINKIVVMVRGKLAQEDILEELGITGIFSKYLIGEIKAEFLDVNEKDDIATSSRQHIIVADPRYQSLKALVKTTLTGIGNVWTEWRNEAGTEVAVEIPAVKEWYEKLPGHFRPAARRLFGKINQLPIDNERDRRIIIKNGIVAFETLRHRESIEKLDNLGPGDLQLLADIFTDLDDLETTLYGQIVRERIGVINALLEKADEAVLERVIQKHIFDHLWLLDAAWERATTGTPAMEKRITTAFAHITSSLTPKEKAARVDIQYRTTAGKHMIVELKRSDRVVSTAELMSQVQKYDNAVKKILVDMGKGNEYVEIVCVVGPDLNDWSAPDGRKKSGEALKAYDARVIKYDELIEKAHEAYQQYLEKGAEVGRLANLLKEIEEWVPEGEKA